MNSDYTFNYFFLQGPGKAEQKQFKFRAVDDAAAIGVIKTFLESHYKEEQIRTGGDFNKCHSIAPFSLEKSVLVADEIKLMRDLR